MKKNTTTLLLSIAMGTAAVFAQTPKQPAVEEESRSTIAIVNFEDSAAAPLPFSAATLDSIATTLAQHPARRYELHAYSCSDAGDGGVGTAAMRAAAARAKAMGSYLVTNGVRTESIKVVKAGNAPEGSCARVVIVAVEAKRGGGVAKPDSVVTKSVPVATAKPDSVVIKPKPAITAKSDSVMTTPEPIITAKPDSVVTKPDSVTAKPKALPKSQLVAAKPDSVATKPDSITAKSEAITTKPDSVATQKPDSATTDHEPIAAAESDSALIEPELIMPEPEPEPVITARPDPPPPTPTLEPPPAPATPQGKPTMAIYMAGDEPYAVMGVHSILGGELARTISASNKYLAVDRTDDIQKQIAKEHIYQRSGAVDDEQIQALGQQLGAQYLCISNINPVGTRSYYLDIRLVDVVTAEIVRTTTANSNFKDANEMTRVARNAAYELIETEKAIAQRKRRTFILRTTSISLDAIGVAALAYGFIENNNADSQLKSFIWSEAEKSISKRNAAYIVGAALLASGVTVHVFF